jgi:hypothetical protein
MPKTLQQELANGITKKFKDAIIKKIDKDNYLDIHLPSVNPKKGTHLGINTAKGEIKIVFYCREDDFNTLALKNSKKIEEYAQGLRIKGNPAFNNASKAIDAAIDFVLELMRVNGNVSKSEMPETKVKKAVPKKAAKKKVSNSIEKQKEQKVDISEEEIKMLHVGDKVNASFFKKTAKLDFWLGDYKEKIIKDILYSDEHEKYLVLTADNKGNSIDYWDMEAVNTQLLDKFKFEFTEENQTENHVEEESEEDDKDMESFIKKLETQLGADDVEEDNEEEIEEEEPVDNKETDLSDFDVNERSVINFICDKIKSGKYLTNLLYINKALNSRGYAVDKHQAYFFDSSVMISDNELEGFLVVNMDGFYSNCMNDEEMKMIFSWSGVEDIEYKENKNGCSIDIVAAQGRLTIKKEASHSLKILYTFYKSVWKSINDKFKDQPIIIWNDVWKMGIKEIGFAEFIDYYTFDVSQEEEEEEEIEEEEEKENEEDEQEENETENQEEDDDSDNLSFSHGKSYHKHFIRFLEIAVKTGISTNNIKVEPNNNERDELWEITRAFAARIYELDNEKSPDQNEINFLSYYTIVALHWCDIFDQKDKRYSYLNGRFRRDTVALALCFYTRIDRTFKYYDFVKDSMIMPHMQFSVLMWSINSIINNNQDTLFGLFNPKQAEQANELFKKLTIKNGAAIPINPNEVPENHPLRSIWWEVYRQFNNVRIPYQFIKSYISQLPPQRSFIQNLLSSNKAIVKPGMNVTLLDEDRIKNVAYLEKQIEHKQFPADWIFVNDLAFVSIYFATTTDGQLSEVEKSTIYKLMGEWITEEDESKTNKQVNDAFIKAKAEFDKDKSHERFEFALENIRRNFFVNYEYDEEKTHNQLVLVFNDLAAIANSDDDETSSEVELLKSILAEWKIEMSEVTGEDNEEDETDEDTDSDEEDEKLKELLQKYGVESESELTSITLEQAKELSNCKVDLNLEGLTSLNEQIARILSKHEGDLYLDGLTKISDKVIEILSSFKGGCLSLGGLESLSDKALEMLAKHEGGQLNLPGLTVISDKAFEMLAKHNGNLNLNGITSLSEKAAQSLSKLNGALMLDGITELSDKAAEFLSKHKGLYLSFDSLTSISDNALLFISKYEGDYLYLNALTSLSDRVALALAKYKGELSLNGLTSLSNKAAAALAEKGISISEDEESEEEEGLDIEDSDEQQNEIYEKDLSIENFELIHATTLLYLTFLNTTGISDSTSEILFTSIKSLELGVEKADKNNEIMRAAKWFQNEYIPDLFPKLKQHFSRLTKLPIQTRKEILKGLRLMSVSFFELPDSKRDLYLGIAKALNLEKDIKAIPKITQDNIDDFIKACGEELFWDELDYFKESGNIVFVSIDCEDLIVSISKGVFTKEMLQSIGSAKIDDWQTIASITNQEEAKSIKKEFKDENNEFIVALYCQGKYVYAYSSPL